MKTLVAAGALAALVTIGGSAVEKWAGYGAQARTCGQICSHTSNVPKEQCVKRCQAVRDRNATKPR
jgi:hypothetical protein